MSELKLRKEPVSLLIKAEGKRWRWAGPLPGKTEWQQVSFLQ